MLAVIQRVSSASVQVAEKSIAKIGQGLLVLLAIEKMDTQYQAEKLCNRIINYRVFPDGQDKMNRSVKDNALELLFVPQFTLLANTKKGNRPSFSDMPDPKFSQSLFNQFIAYANSIYPKVQCGQFGAEMQVSLVNDGPVTFLLKA